MYNQVRVEIVKKFWGVTFTFCAEAMTLRLIGILGFAWNVSVRIRGSAVISCRSWLSAYPSRLPRYGFWLYVFVCTLSYSWRCIEAYLDKVQRSCSSGLPPQ